MASTLTRLGQLAAVTGHHHAACKRYSEALTMLRHAHSRDDANVEDDDGRLAAGGGRIRPSTSSDLEDTSTQHADIAKVLALLGHVHAVAGKRRYAAAYFDQAVTMMEVVRQQPGAATVDGRRRHAALLEKICQCREDAARMATTTAHHRNEDDADSKTNGDGLVLSCLLVQLRIAHRRRQMSGALPPAI